MYKSMAICGECGGSAWTTTPQNNWWTSYRLQIIQILQFVNRISIQTHDNSLDLSGESEWIIAGLILAKASCGFRTLPVKNKPKPLHDSMITADQCFRHMASLPTNRKSYQNPNACNKGEVVWNTLVEIVKKNVNLLKINNINALMWYVRIIQINRDF